MSAAGASARLYLGPGYALWGGASAPPKKCLPYRTSACAHFAQALVRCEHALHADAASDPATIRPCHKCEKPAPEARYKLARPVRAGKQNQSTSEPRRCDTPPPHLRCPSPLRAVATSNTDCAPALRQY